MSNKSTTNLPAWPAPTWARIDDSDLDVSVSHEGNPMSNWGRNLVTETRFESSMNQWATMDAKTKEFTLGELTLNVYFDNNDGVQFTNPGEARAAAHHLIAAINAFEAALEEAGL